MKRYNEFWKVCEALDNRKRIELLRYLIQIETTEFPCVNELAETFDVTSAAMSLHLKKLANAGLVSMKRADRRVYYRAFPTTKEGARVMDAMRAFFAATPTEDRILALLDYIHALSHVRRAVIVRCLQREPGLSLSKLVAHTHIPMQTADRLWGELAQTHVINLNGTLVFPPEDPERVLLTLTLE